MELATKKCADCASPNLKIMDLVKLEDEEYYTVKIILELIWYGSLVFQGKALVEVIRFLFLCFIRYGFPRRFPF
jgi:hypothetical protein